MIHVLYNISIQALVTFDTYICLSKHKHVIMLPWINEFQLHWQSDTKVYPLFSCGLRSVT